MMPLGQTQPKPFTARNAAIAAGVTAAHGLVVALLCWQPTTTALPQHGDPTASMVMLSLAPATLMPAAPAPPVQTAPPEPPTTPETPVSPEGLEPAPLEAEPTPPAPSIAPPLTAEDAAVLAAFSPPSLGDPTSPCNLTQSMASVFAQSPEVQYGLAALPVANRSVANAVMLWDGEWASDTQSGGKALLRGLLLKALSSARPECLNGLNRGPVLFLVPDRGTTVVLAIGSGEWRWGDLLNDETGFGDFLLSAASKTPAAP